MIKLIFKRQLLLLLLISGSAYVYALPDTLHVMAYNVLYYGDRPACQGPHNLYHGYLKTIVQYANPDILGLEKLAAIPMYVGDVSGTAPTGFADSILQYSLNSAFPGRYAYCPFTNTSAAGDLSALFYNQQKLGFCSIVSSYSNITDFNTYKLYYKAADLAVTHDTIFLYITLNHTQSGSGSSSISARAAQISGEMTALHSVFSALPNVVNMGDFNFHNSSEAGYQQLVNPSDTNFRFYDPPFSPDLNFLYPADWDTNPSSYAGYLTTSTRLSSSVPNSCGTSGGGKSWYDHIFLSSPIVNNSNNLQYVYRSYRTIGNDGHRVNISINDAPTNTSAPAAVISALYQMSNKYPVMVDIAVHTPTTGLTDVRQETKAGIGNPVGDYCDLNISSEFLGSRGLIKFFDLSGRISLSQDVNITATKLRIPVALVPGIYVVQLLVNNGVVLQTKINKQ